MSSSSSKDSMFSATSRSALELQAPAMLSGYRRPYANFASRREVWYRKYAVSRRLDLLVLLYQSPRREVTR